MLDGDIPDSRISIQLAEKRVGNVYLLPVLVCIAPPRFIEFLPLLLRCVNEVSEQVDTTTISNFDTFQVVRLKFFESLLP